MAHYDPAKHSKNKLGLSLHALIVPSLPIAAQVSIESGIMHLMLEGGVYVGVYKPIACLHPDEWVTLQTALPSCPDEPTYSGSGSTYKQLTVEKGEGVAEGSYVGTGPAAFVRAGAGGPILARVYVDPLCPVCSTDEDPLTGQKLPSGIAKMGTATIPGISLEDPKVEPDADLDEGDEGDGDEGKKGGVH